jgi:hypothetical protein
VTLMFPRTNSTSVINFISPEYSKHFVADTVISLTLVFFNLRFYDEQIIFLESTCTFRIMLNLVFVSTHKLQTVHHLSAGTYCAKFGYLTKYVHLMFVDPYIIVQFLQKNQQDATGIKFC